MCTVAIIAYAANCSYENIQNVDYRYDEKCCGCVWTVEMMVYTVDVSCCRRVE